MVVTTWDAHDIYPLGLCLDWNWYNMVTIVTSGHEVGIVGRWTTGTIFLAGIFYHIILDLWTKTGKEGGGAINVAFNKLAETDLSCWGYLGGKNVGSDLLRPPSLPFHIKDVSDLRRAFSLCWVVCWICETTAGLALYVVDNTSADIILWIYAVVLFFSSFSSHPTARSKIMLLTIWVCILNVYVHCHMHFRLFFLTKLLDSI
jgi:hypothetical protein